MLRLFRGDPRRAVPDDTISVDHDGETFNVTLRRSSSARRFTLRVRTATREVVLTMPARGSVRAARAFAQRYAGWIDTRLQRLPDRIAFEPGSLIPLRGVEHRIVHQAEVRGTAWAELDVTGQTLLMVAGDKAHVSRRITDFLKREARRDIVAAVERHARAAGVQAKSVTLRDTTSRWGSCSSRGSLSFSWRLILAPPLVLDYLAAHEVAHLVHMNHSAAYWQLTKRLAPQTERAEAWLKSHGASLHRYTSEALQP